MAQALGTGLSGRGWQPWLWPAPLWGPGLDPLPIGGSAFCILPQLVTWDPG